VVGVPAAADVGGLLGGLLDLGDHRIAGGRGEEAVDVDRRDPLGQGDMLLGRDRLAADGSDDRWSPCRLLRRLHLLATPPTKHRKACHFCNRPSHHGCDVLETAIGTKLAKMRF
jgi:hypothetical protein